MALREAQMKRLIAIAAAAVFICIGQFASPAVSLAIVTGSENTTLEPLMIDWAKSNNVALTMTHLGSVDILPELEKGTAGA